MSERAPKRPKNPPPTTTLLDDEAFLGTWQPDFFTFLKRALLLGFVSSLFFGSFSVANTAGVFFFNGLNFLMAFVIFIALLVVFTLMALFVFDDHTNWIRHRSDVWHLTSYRLIYENQADPAQNAAINLSDIDTVKRALWKSLRLQLFTGQSTMVKYLASPKSLQTAITEAKAQNEGTSDA